MNTRKAARFRYPPHPCLKIFPDLDTGEWKYVYMRRIFQQRG